MVGGKFGSTTYRGKDDLFGSNKVQRILVGGRSVDLPAVEGRWVNTAASSSASGEGVVSEKSAAKNEKVEGIAATISSSANASSISSPPSPDEASLRWKPAPKFALGHYKSLSKAKLSAFVVLTTMCGYAMAPGAATAVTAAAASTSVFQLLYTTVGTALCVASANSFNQWVEAPYDAQMARTASRVLVRRAMSPVHAFSVGVISGVAGVTILGTCVNSITALLGAANIVLYAGIYTPLKRTSIWNTWVGAIVGAIPPVMGWVAVTSSLDQISGALILAGILYAWQFPHFNALSWNLRGDYSKAGYRMMAVTDPALTARVALRYSLALFPLCLAAPYVGLTDMWFALDSSVINAVLAIPAFRFWRRRTDANARALFFASLIYLPVTLGLLMLHKVKE